MKRVSFFFVSALLWAITPPLFSAESTTTELFGLINKRLSYMKDVAAYKWVHEKPVEDLAREAVVLEKSAQKAEKEGLDSESTEAFFIAQITVAKNIQTAWQDQWRENGFPQQLDFKDLADIRGALISLGDEILLATKEALPTLHNTQQRTQLCHAFKESITTEMVSDKDKIMLFNGLTQIQEAHKRDEL